MERGRRHDLDPPVNGRARLGRSDVYTSAVQKLVWQWRAWSMARRWDGSPRTVDSLHEFSVHLFGETVMGEPSSDRQVV